MAYVALYRRFRPKTFDDVIGQNHIVTILKNQVASQRISHAYLFCGTRGTGKTSTAKILAKSIRCLNPANGQPCNQCNICLLDSDESSDVDIIEIDAASNNSVDEIRDLREKVRLSPVCGNYKVYIIDEVHMLSSGAFNALLKTLEEPPKHVVFILATTESHKLPATIISRCQRFDFNRVSVPDIVSRLEYVLESCGATWDSDALKMIARMSNGGLRDALSLLDQCFIANQGNLTKENVQDALGNANDAQLSNLVDAIISRNASLCLSTLQKTLDAGRDLPVLISDMMKYFRDLMLVSVSNDTASTSILSDDAKDTIIQQVNKIDIAFIIRAIDILAKLQYDLKLSLSAQTLTEAALVRICSEKLDESKNALIARIEQLEKRLESGNFVLNDKTDNTISPNKDEPKAILQPKPTKPVDPKPAKRDNGDNHEGIKTLFNKALEGLKKQNMGLYMVMRNSQLSSYKDDVLTIQFSEKNAMFTQVVNKQDSFEMILDVFRRVFDKKLTIKTIVSDKPSEIVDAKISVSDSNLNDENSPNLVEATKELFGAENVIINE